MKIILILVSSLLISSLNAQTTNNYNTTIDEANKVAIKNSKVYIAKAGTVTINYISYKTNLYLKSVSSFIDNYGLYETKFTFSPNEQVASYAFNLVLDFNARVFIPMKDSNTVMLTATGQLTSNGETFGSNFTKSKYKTSGVVNGLADLVLSFKSAEPLSATVTGIDGKLY